MSLDVLFPEEEVLLIAGESVAVLPFMWGRYPGALKLMLPAVFALRRAGLISINKNGELVLLDDWMGLIGGAMQIMADSGEDLIALCGYAINKPRDWFDNIGADDGIKLLRAVLMVNANFFRNRTVQMLGLSVTVTPTPDGLTASTSSSEQATTEAT